MCGRFQFKPQGNALLMDEFGLPEEPDFPERINLAPSQQAPVIYAHNGLPNFEPMQWGLVPSWVKSSAVSRGLINARVETVAVKPSFRDALKHRRCLVLSSGYYKWKVRGGTPTLIQAKDASVFAFAGLWEPGVKLTPGAPRTCTILTMEACPELADMHPRMPIILSQEQQSSWLFDGIQPDCLHHAFRLPFPIVQLSVSKRLNAVAHDDASCLMPDIEPPGLFD